MTADEPVDFQALLERIAGEVEGEVGKGQVADYIPALAQVPAERFGMALATVDGGLYGVGDWRERLSLQSDSDMYSLDPVTGQGPAHPCRLGRLETVPNSLN